MLLGHGGLGTFELVGDELPAEGEFDRAAIDVVPLQGYRHFAGPAGLVRA